MATKTLRVTLADIIGVAGPSGRLHGEVWARFVDGNNVPREVRYTDGTLVTIAQARLPLNDSGYVDFVVVPNDDATVHVDDRGFGIQVGWDLTIRGPRGVSQPITSNGRTVVVTSSSPAIAQFGLLATASPVIVGTSYITQGTADANYPRRDSAPKSLADFGVLPGNTAAQNRTAFTSAAASGYTDLVLPPGTYQWAMASNGTWMMTFTNQNRIRIRGINAVINDTSSYSNNGPLEGVFQFDNCKDVEISGIEYVGPVLSSPTTLLGYQGATVVRAVNGTDGVKVDMRMTNCRYGLQTGEYGDASKGQCKNFDLRVRGSMIGYPLAAYYADGIRHDINVDGTHRAVYIAGCNDVTGVARWKNQYIADTAYLITDCLTAGTDAAAQADPTGSPTSSRGCSNVDVTSIDMGSTVFQASSRCAGIGLSRVDPCTFRNIKIRVQSKGDNTTSSTVGGFMMASSAKSVQTRYPFNWEPGIVMENIEVGGVIDHSASTGVGNSGSEFYVVAYDSTTGHAATIRGFKVDGFTFLPSSGNARPSYFHAPGLASPAEFRHFHTPGVSFAVYTNASVQTHLRECTIAQLDPEGLSGGSKVSLTNGTTATSVASTDGPYTRMVVQDGAAIGGAGPAIYQREITLALTGASVTWTGAIPGGSIVLGVSGRIQALITGSTGHQVGVSGDIARFANRNDLNPGLTFTPAAQAVTETSPKWYLTTTDIVVTSKTSNFTGGSMRLVLTYMNFSVPNA